jgi:hypothetical protein
MGGGLLPALLYGRRLWGSRALLAGLGAWAALAILCAAFGAWARADPRLTHPGLVGAQAAFYLLGGVSILVLAVTDFRRDPGPESVLLLAWVLGTFVFCGFVNWTVNARSLLPMAPALAILMLRRRERSVPPGGVVRWLPLIVSFAVTLLVASADARLAQTEKEAAVQLGAQAQESHRRVWFEGHWGFQYYAQLAGLQAIDLRRLDLIQPDDVLVQPTNNSNVRELLRADAPQTRATLELLPFPWLSTMSAPAGAGFYDVVGPLPFVFGEIPPERYTVIVQKAR